ncbi:hypothetical protein CIL05_17470 [Virgibacillus profundi]|uniref:HNH nuclease domain-containing protein n=1 Tax=Virgibacillus profundi TaxID=2024555 RepID=A0A2A2I8T7_9BACI|nr:HNH endonuclease signature motif containing protein [Virgibacillus profundi]PAV28421.1 hypothetical protein CIL05_17470 [Virgibacillus profundi]PXY52217.1 HNH endonuclease [Virgibacillus profundi]
MAIPKNIRKEHIISAIEKIDKEGVPDNRKATRFYLLYQDEHYPPKYVLSIANIFANGLELLPSEFSGGRETNQYLKELDFNIIEQAKADILFSQILSEIKTRNIDITKEVTITEVVNLVPYKATAIENYTSYAYAITSMLSNQKKRDYFLFENQEVQDRLTFLAKYQNRSNHEWKLSYSNEIVWINPKYYTRIIDKVDEDTKIQEINKRLREKIEKHGELVLEQSFENMDEEGFASLFEADDKSAAIIEIEGIKKVRKYNKEHIQGLKSFYKYQCQICGHSTEEEYGVSIVEAHHITPFSLTQDNNIDNLMILCPNHHRLIHKANGQFNWAKNEIVYENGMKEKLKLNGHLK